MGGFGKKGTKCDLYKFTTCNIYANVQLPQVSFFFLNLEKTYLHVFLTLMNCMVLAGLIVYHLTSSRVI